MKKLFGILLVLIYSFSIFAEKGDTLPNNTYKTGEKLIYKLEYGWIIGGMASLTLQEKELNGKKYHYVAGIGKTIGVTDRLFKVLDIYESYFDIYTCKPTKTIRNIREDNYRRYDVATYNSDNSVAYSTLKKADVKLPKGSLDVVSMFYFARRKSFNNLKSGDVLSFDTYFNEEYWNLKIRYIGVETIEMDFGKVNCLKFKPVVEPGTFKNPDALTVYVSNDANHIPVRVEMDFFVGSFRTDLTSYSGLMHTFKFEAD